MATSQDEAMLSPDGQNQPDQNSSSSLASTNQVVGGGPSGNTWIHSGDQVETLEELARALSISDDQNATFQRLLAKEQKSEIPYKKALGTSLTTDSQYNSLMTVQSAFKSRKLFPSAWVVAECKFQHTLRKPAAGERPNDITNSSSLLYGPNVVENNIKFEGVNYTFPKKAQCFLDYNQLGSVSKRPFIYTVKNPQLSFSKLFEELSIDEILDGAKRTKTAPLVKPGTSSVASNTVQSENVSKMNDAEVETAANLQSNSISNVQNKESESPLPIVNYYKYLTPSELVISCLHVKSSERINLDCDLEQLTYNITLSRMAFLRAAEPAENRKNRKHLFSCKFCDKSFKDKAALSFHMKTHEWSSAYKCETCGKMFPFQSSLSKHKLLHSDVLDLTSTSIQLSERNRSEVQLSSCPFCYKSFVDKGLLSQHMKYHEWSGTYKCDICSKVFNFQSALHKHMLVHERTVFAAKTKLKQLSESLSCELCNKSYKSKTLLSLHMKSHECYNCGLTFKYQDGLLDHKLQCQANVPGTTIKDPGRRRNENQLLSCKFCDESFKNKAALFEHLKSHQWSDLYKCEICGKIFNFQSSLLKHKLEHSGAGGSASESQGDDPGKPELQCTSCLESLPTDSLVTEHMKSHDLEICDTIISPPQMLLADKLRFHSDDRETAQMLSHLKL